MECRVAGECLALWDERETVEGVWEMLVEFLRGSLKIEAVRSVSHARIAESWNLEIDHAASELHIVGQLDSSAWLV